jgi:hypothetical protein
VNGEWAMVNGMFKQAGGLFTIHPFIFTIHHYPFTSSYLFTIHHCPFTPSYYIHPYFYLYEEIIVRIDAVAGSGRLIWTRVAEPGAIHGV